VVAPSSSDGERGRLGQTGAHFEKKKASGPAILSPAFFLEFLTSKHNQQYLYSSKRNNVYTIELASDAMIKRSCVYNMSRYL
jgi:hypothetical protein